MRRNPLHRPWTLLILALALLLCVPAQPAVTAPGCFTNFAPGTTSLGGVVNTYYAGSGDHTSGVTRLYVDNSSKRPSGAPDLAPGDLILVLQMQEAAIDSSNSASYGDGGGAGSGYTALNDAGLYEYAVVQAYDSGTGEISLVEPTLNPYSTAPATLTAGQTSFQVVRVPAYLNVTLTSNLAAEPWNGRSGGVLALEVINDLDMNGFIAAADGAGFRGGGERRLSGGSGANSDFVTLSTNAANGSKGEGIAGTPRFVYDAVGPAVTDTAPAAGDGYPAGSFARGAPGNAGGGGTDGNPAANDQNSGGGGGGNGGAGGQGGNSWSSNLAVGGRGGAALPAGSADWIFLGGGGGAGSNNNNSNLGSSGAAGGGAILVRARSAFDGLFSANGANAPGQPLNDSGGGGGAGGSVYVLTTIDASFAVTALGGAGGVASNTGQAHGPGGGGGGGVVRVASLAAFADVSGGANGLTLTTNPYGATAGAAGVVDNALAALPGAPAGFSCFTPTAVNLSALRASSGGSPWLLLAAGILAFGSLNLVLAYRRRQKKS